MWWSWALAAVGVTGIYLTTRHMWQGFLIGICAQVLWVAYAVVTNQWGFLATAFAYGAVNAVGLRRWLVNKRDLP